jgi:chitin synthase
MCLSTSRKFCDQYKDRLEDGAVIEGGEREHVKQARTAFGLAEADVVMGQQKVLLSQFAFQKFEDQLLSRDVEEQKQNRMRTVETKAGHPFLTGPTLLSPSHRRLATLPQK